MAFKHAAVEFVLHIRIQFQCEHNAAVHRERCNAHPYVDGVAVDGDQVRVGICNAIEWIEP